MDSVLPMKVKNIKSKSIRKKKSDKAGKPKSSNLKQGSRKKFRFNRSARATIYLGHIPHGFYENEMKSYFNQFGKVLSAKVARSKKTGRSKGYGFVEFADEEVAKIAAETMNNYLMFNRVIKCRYIPPEERKGKQFMRAISVYDYPRKTNRKINAKQIKANALAKLDQQTFLSKTQKKMNEFRKFFEERGIDFTFTIKVDGDENHGAANNGNHVEKSLNFQLQSETEDEKCDQLPESDNEINFRIPCQVKNAIKTTVNSSLPSDEVISSENLSARKRKNTSKNSNAHKTEKKNNPRTKSCLPNIKQKPKNKKKLSSKSETKNVASVSKKKKSTSLKDINLSKSKSRKNLKSDDTKGSSEQKSSV